MTFTQKYERNIMVNIVKVRKTDENDKLGHGDDNDDNINVIIFETWTLLANMLSFKLFLTKKDLDNNTMCLYTKVFGEFETLKLKKWGLSYILPFLGAILNFTIFSSEGPTE